MDNVGAGVQGGLDDALRMASFLAHSGVDSEGGDGGPLRECGDIQDTAKLTKLKPADEATWREDFMNDILHIHQIVDIASKHSLDPNHIQGWRILQHILRVWTCQEE